MSELAQQPPTRQPAPDDSPLKTRSLRGRVTVAVLLFVAVMLLLLGVTANTVLDAQLTGDLRQRLTDRASTAEALVDQVSARDLVDRLEGDGVSVQLRSSSGQVIGKGPLQPGSISTAPAPAPAPKGPAGPAKGPAAPITQQGDIYQVSQQLSDGSQLILLASAADVRRTLAQVRTTLLVGGALVLMLAAIALGPVIGRALRPLDSMTSTARSITAGNRGRRLRPDRPGTELGRTAIAFDAMLDEVEGAEAKALAAETRLRHFLSDAAHELRTPLAGVQAAAERLLLAEPDRSQREQLSVTVIRETRRASRLVEDMLTMARIDQGLDLNREPVDLFGLTQRVVATKQLRHPDARITVDGSRVEADVDSDRYTQVLDNLLDNAVHAAGPHARIRVLVSAEATSALVDVNDNGPGVRPDDAERIFDRLVRIDPSGASHGGFGFGLPIARGIARAHGGDLAYLVSDEPGAHFRFSLPTQSS